MINDRKFGERFAGSITSEDNPLDLIERDLIVAAVVELGRACAFMRRHLLSVFEQTAIEQINGDAGRAEAVAADLREKTGLFGAAPAGLFVLHAFLDQRSTVATMGDAVRQRYATRPPV